MAEIVPIVVMIIIIIVVAFLVYSIFLSKPKNTKTPTTYASVNSSVGLAQQNTTVHFYAINIKYVYSGPSKINNTPCDYGTLAYVDSVSYTAQGGTTFPFTLEPTTTACPLNITNIEMSTSGFAVLSTNPTMPLEMPPNSQELLQIDIATPQANFDGPISITISDN